MGSSKKVTVGYRYYMGLHFGICHGPVDAVYGVSVGDRSAWSGVQSTSGAISISAPDLFGGDKREGGIVGTLDVCMGAATQAANSYLTSKMPGIVPAFRGILSMVWRGGLVTSNNPYVKPWAFRVKRILQGWSTGSAWYPETAEIGVATTYVTGDEWAMGTAFPTYVKGVDPEYPGFGGTHPATLTIGPFAENAEILAGDVAATDTVYVDDRFIFNGDEAARSTFAWGDLLFDLPAGDTLTIGVKNIWDTGCGATGYIHVRKEVVDNHLDMNPAHIIYECLTDSEWGMGYPTAAIDSDSFTAAADALYAENFGLSLLWNRQETIENFLGIILNHIGGILYVRPDTGAFALKLIRADYDRETLPTYGPSTLISADDYQRQAWGETINEITVIYTDIASGKDTSITVQDAANILAQGGVVAQQRNYPGIRRPFLAQRVAMRDLNSASTPLAKVKLTATRAAWQVFPGDVFRLTWPEYDIDDVVYRVLAVNRGTLTDGQIVIDAVEDVFGLPENTYLVDQPSEWEDPSSDPAAAPYRAVVEAPYWDLARNLSAADLDYVDALSGYLETLAVRPSGDAVNYSIHTRTGAAAYVETGNGDFCPSAIVVPALTKTTTAITLSSGVDLDLVTVGGYAVIENEYVLVSAIDAGAGTATISRGVLDTVPAEHAAGSRIWFADGYVGFDGIEYADGETLDVKMCPLTGRGELDASLAPVNILTFDQRQYRPYPPGNLKFDGVAYPEDLNSSSDVVLTWAHRDRLSQTAYIVGQDEASIGPEASTTYSVEVADEALTVLHSATGITAATATVPASALTTGLLRWRLWSVRGGLASYQIHEHWASWGDVRITEAGETRTTEAGELRITD